MCSICKSSEEQTCCMQQCNEMQEHVELRINMLGKAKTCAGDYHVDSIPDTLFFFFPKNDRLVACSTVAMQRSREGRTECLPVWGSVESETLRYVHEFRGIRTRE
jgi:hypothetical protein